MATTINDANDLETLGKVAQKLAQRSADTYTTASVSVWKMLAGDETWDMEKLTKNATRIWGQAAADATNAAMIAQKLAKLAASGGGGKG